MARRKLSVPNYVLRRNRQGNFEVRWTDPATGKTRFKSCHTDNEAEALSLMGNMVANLSLPSPVTEFRAGPIFAAYLNAKPKQVHTLKPLQERLSYLVPSQLNNAVVRAYADWRHANGIADGTILRELGGLRAALNWGADNGLGYKRTDIGTFRMPMSKPPPKDRWLTRHEVWNLLVHGCPTDDQRHVRLFVRLALHSGARSQALLTLTWDRVVIPDEAVVWCGDDPTKAPPTTPHPHCFIDLGRGVGNKRRVRNVPITDNPMLVCALVEARKMAKSNYVIEYNGRPVGNIKTALNKAYERAGIPDASGSHLLRHTCVTLLVMAGLSYERIGKQVGTSAKMVEEVYGHHSPEFLHAVGNITSF